MWPVMEQKLARFRELEAQLEDPSVASDPHKAGAVAKEHGSLRKLVLPYQDFLSLEKQIADSEAMLTESDAEMRQMAEEELVALRPR